MSDCRLSRRQFVRRWTGALAGMAAGQLGLPALAAAGPVAGGTLNMSLGPDFVTLDPWYDVPGSEFRATPFEAPMRPNPRGTAYEPWLAEAVTESPDGLAVTLRMRRGVKFHNGRELTAADVVWSVGRAMNSQTGAHLSDRFRLAKDAVQVDTHTLRITYTQRDPSKYVGIANLFLYPREAAQSIARKPVGTGPFKFDEWVPGDHLTVSRFDGYWRKGIPRLDRIVVKPLPDEESRVLSLQGGAVQLLMGLPLADASRLSRTPGFAVYTSPPGRLFYSIIMNIEQSPFDDRLVREAMGFAVDRDKINRIVFHGLGLMTQLPYPKSSWAYDATLASTYRYDPARAKQLLVQAGYPNGVNIEILVEGSSGPHLQIAQVYQQDLALAGIRATLIPMPLPQYFQKLYNSEFAVVSHSTGETDLDPNGLFIGAACCRPFRNFFNIPENPDWFPHYRDLIYRARDEADEATRKQLYHQILVVLQQQNWLIPIAWDQAWFGYRTNVKQFRMDMHAHLWLDEAWVAR